MNDPDGFPLADLQQAELDPETLDQLFADLAQCTEIIGALLKGAPKGYAPERLVDLATARALLAARQVRGIQVRYRYQDKEWWDTLLALPTGVRLVRICHSDARAAAAPAGADPLV